MTNSAAKGLAERFGRYHLLGALGEGSMGPLHVAEQSGDDGFVETVALRILHSHLTESASTKLLLSQATRLASVLKHPNIAPSDELEEADGFHFFATEYLPGENLASILASCSRTPMPTAVAAALAYNCAEALRFAHDTPNASGTPLGLVHQDLRPANVFLTYHGVVQLVGFGAGGLLSQIPGVRGSSRGGFSYTAPEALEGAPPDTRGDIFSLGVMLWECLAGKQLFGAETIAKSKDAVRSRYVEPPSILRKEVPSGLDEIVLRALSRDPRRRYQDLAEVSRALKRVLMSLPRAPATEDMAEWLRHVFGAERASLKIQIAQGQGVPGALARLRLLGEPSPVEAVAAPSERRNSPAGTGTATLPPPSFRAGPPPAPPLPGDGPRPSQRVPTIPPATPGLGTAKAVVPEPPPAAAAAPRKPPIAIIGGVAAAIAVVGALWFFRPSDNDVPIGEEGGSTMGALQIDSTPPGAQVLIDGDPSGLVTPAKVTGLRAGRKVDIQVGLPGYRSTRQSVEVPAGGGLKTLSFALEESSGIVQLDGLPRGATTYIDDAPVNTSQPLSVAIGPRRLRVEVGGELYSSMKIDVRAGKQAVRVHPSEGAGK